MAIIETGAIFKSLRFDGVDSRDYGVYITGEAVYNAPERDVEMVVIPGRNGAYALDKGRFNNITVTYPAGLFQQNETDFKTALSDFRNALCSRVGYKRLEDDYHTDEFRLAVYKGGLEVTPANLEAGEFAITFECKPQRFLTSGEAEIVVKSAITPRSLHNTTLFPASPLIYFSEDNTLTIGENTIEVADSGVPLGDITLWNAQTLSPGTSTTVTMAFDASHLNTGDGITLEDTAITYGFRTSATSPKPTGVTITNETGDPDVTASTDYLVVTFRGDAVTNRFAYGTAKTVNKTFTATVTLSNGSSKAINFSLSIAYDGATTFTFTRNYWGPTSYRPLAGSAPEWNVGTLVGDSTKTNPAGIWIDTELGYAWSEIGGEKISMNDRVTFSGADLPTIPPGDTLAQVSTTTTDGVTIIPRWWKI